MSDPYGSQTGQKRGEQPQNIATAIAEVSERATLLVREEIELAKAEIAEKASGLVRGAIVGAAAGIFFVTALFFVLIGFAYLLYYYLPGNVNTYFWGFFAMAAILVLLGCLAGYLAARAVKRGAPPTPSMAIEEARKIREAVSTGPEGPGTAVNAASSPVATAAEASPAATQAPPETGEASVGWEG